MREVVIVGAVRTPVGKRNGALSDQHAADLSALVLNELVERTGVAPEIIDDVVWGCVSQVGDQSSNIGRYAVLAAGWPEHVPGTTVNRACGSSQQAVDFAVQAVMSGQQDVVVAGGVEVMSRVPLGAARATGMPYGPKVLARYDDFSFNQGISAELIAQQWNLSRTRLDQYSARSHELAAAAQDSGAFKEQIVPVFTEGAVVTDDEGVRRATTPDKLSGLKPAFTEDGVAQVIEAYLMKGDILEEKLGYSDKAALHFEKVLMYDKTNSKAMRRLSEICLVKEDLVKARKWAEVAVRTATEQEDLEGRVQGMLLQAIALAPSGDGMNDLLEKSGSETVEFGKAVKEIEAKIGDEADAAALLTLYREHFAQL